MALDLHIRAERCLVEADLAASRGDRETERRALLEAARWEEQALLATPSEREHSRSNLAVSAVSLYLRAGRSGLASELVERLAEEPGIREPALRRARLLCSFDLSA